MKDRTTAETTLSHVERSGHTLHEHFLETRRFTEWLCAPLSAEDCAIQSMPDVSPTRWHLAHTTWFFETFILAKSPEYHLYNPTFEFLFNSYYNAIGEQFPRGNRGLLSRPGLDEIWDYRRHVDRHLAKLLAESDDAELSRLTEVGIHHERQHQELMLTDIKHVLSCNPLRPAYRQGSFALGERGDSTALVEFDEGVCWIGHESDGFAFDNESPRHRVFLDEFSLRSCLVTCGDYLQFIADGGYQRSEFWLSLGWQTVCDRDWTAPLYWFQEDGAWHQFTLAGPREVDALTPVTHISYFEADAFARWAGMRLPTEAEWEVASEQASTHGNFVDSLLATGEAIHPRGDVDREPELVNMFGDVWEWTASPYVPYPGYSAPRGAIGEYNGKFMCNQYVLRGGSCATSSDHIRRTYRNYFPPDARWQFTGIRLCR